MADFESLIVKSADEIRDDLLRSLRVEFARIGVRNLNVAPGGDYYALATAISRELAVAMANAPIAADAMLPDSAQGTDLIRWRDALRLPPKDATGSAGFVIFDTAARSAVVVGAQLLDAQGLKYTVSVGGTYRDNEPIPIESQSAGSETELPEGATLRWVAAPPFAAETVVVAPPGLKGGGDAESEEALRDRIFAHLANPPAAGNWQHIAELAEAASPRVQRAFIYPALQGPSTVHYAIVAAATKTNKNRSVPLTTLRSIVIPTLEGLLEEHSYLVGTTVSNLEVDVAIALSLPAAGSASPPGPGGGFLDGTPWPVFGESRYVAITQVESPTKFSLNADRAPVKGVSRVAWLSPTDWLLYQATVIDSSPDVGTGLYQIVIDTPFVNIAPGCLLWPQALQQQQYVDAILRAFAAMGPGEKTTNPSALVRGFRHPVPTNSWPYSLHATQLRAISDSGSEVLDASYLYRSIITPPVPTAVTDAPNILVPRHIGFYPT